MEQLIYLTQSLNLSKTREGLMCGFPLNITEIKKIWPEARIKSIVFFYD